MQLVDSTGASITNKGIFYEPGKEPGPNDLPKLHLLIESNEEFRVRPVVESVCDLGLIEAVSSHRSSTRSPKSRRRSSKEPRWLSRCVGQQCVIVKSR